MATMIIDGNSLGYAAHGTQPLTVDGMQVQAVFQSLKMLKAALSHYPKHQTLIWLWDGRAQWRYDLHPEYKGKREETEEQRKSKEAYKAALPYLERALTALGVTQIRAPAFEADDVAGYFVRRLSKVGAQGLLLSGDRDWIQLITPTIDWVDPRDGHARKCDLLSLEAFSGSSTPQRFLEAKALQGDTSDCIPGVGGIGEKTAVALIEHFGSILELVRHFKTKGEFQKGDLPGSLDRMRNKINAFLSSNFAQFRKNYTLMNLMSAARDADIAADMQVNRPAAPNWDDFEALCHELAFLSITTQMPAWKRAFGG